jgi:hypothetical protein
MSRNPVAVKTSGTSKLPSLLPLPKPIPIDEFMGIRGMFCYVIEHYGHSGLSLLIHRDGEDVQLVIGDWDGNIIPLDDDKHPLYMAANACLNSVAIMSYNVLKHIGVDKAILYFAKSGDKFILVDARMSLNKFAGPGMLQDVFGKVLETQKVICIETINDAIMDSIMVGRDQFSPSILLKPSRFRFATMGDDPIPLYVEVMR